MLLSRFILNTDYDTQKQADIVVAEISGNSFILPATSPDRLKIFEIDVPADVVVAFENITILSSLFDNTVLVGDYAIYDDGNIEISFFVTKPTNSAYHFKVRMLNYSGQPQTIPAYSFKARIHRFVPSSQD